MKSSQLGALLFVDKEDTSALCPYCGKKWDWKRSRRDELKFQEHKYLCGEKSPCGFNTEDISGKFDPFKEINDPDKVAAFNVAKKITHYDDLKLLECLRRPSKDTFIGQGFDVHAFCDDKKMVLAGVKIDSNLGFKAHSDGDVAIHALIDALLGAIGHGDIGELYPDNDDKYKDMDSKEMLKDVVNFINIVGYQIVNVDLTIMAEYPKISAYKDSMRRVIAKILAIDPIFCNIKATTTEKLGFIGRKEGVAVSAVCSLKFFDWGSGKE